MTHYDIIIIGNGMVGASLAAAMAQHDWSIAIIDKQPVNITETDSADSDGRKIALSLGSQHILHAFGVWPQLTPWTTPIEQVHISAQGQFGATRLSAADINSAALGHVVPAMRLNLVLQKTLTPYANITFYCPGHLEAIDVANNSVVVNGNKLTAKLIVGADGVMSASRQLLEIETDTRDYEHSALVSSIQLARSHHNIAYQRFSNIGTLALLPMQNKTCGLVCTAHNRQIDRLMAEDDADVLAQIQAAFGYRLGRLQQLGPRYRYPLKKIIAKTQVKQQFLLLGNAAHNMSPVAAQGFNLALQDVYCLEQLLLKHPNDIPAALQQYLLERTPEQQRIIKLTDRLMTLNDHDKLSSGLIGLGLAAFDVSNKKSFVEQAAGISGQVKRLMRASSSQT